MTQEKEEFNSESETSQIEGMEKEGSIAVSHYTRWAASAVLVMAVPLLLFSSLALVIFYAAPARFESILSRLPGEAAIRTVLIFAPVTLLAIIVLAVLYAFEKPSVEVTRPQVVRSMDVLREPITWFDKLNIQRITWWILLLTFAMLLVLIPARSAAFLSPTRFENFLGRYPGKEALNFIVHSGPIVLLVVEVFAVILFVGTRIKPMANEREVLMPGMRWLRKIGPTRLSVGIVLVFSLPILLVSFTSLFLFFTRTESLLLWIDRLPGEVPIRMGLVFIPVSLIIVVALAVLFLIRQRSSMDVLSREPSAPSKGLKFNLDLLLWYLTWILAWVITLASATIVGLVIGLMVLILR
jgi:hypothetical protein